MYNIFNLSFLIYLEKFRFRKNNFRGDIMLIDCALFISNLAIISMRCILCFCFLLFYQHTHKTFFFWLSVLFLSLTVDTALLCMSELLPEFAPFYNSHVRSEPILRSLLTVSYLISYRMLMYHGLRFSFRQWEPAAFLSLFLITPLVSLVPLAPMSNLAYNTLTWGYTFYIFGVGIRLCTPQMFSEVWYVRIRFVLSIMLILQILYYLETLFWIDSQLFLLELWFPSIGQCPLFSALIDILLDASGLYLLYTILAQHSAVLLPASAPGLQPPDYHALCTAYRLTPREEEIFVQLMENRKNGEIAQALYIAPGTVKSHIHNIFTKFEVKSREELKEKVAQMQPTSECGALSRWQTV